MRRTVLLLASMALALLLVSGIAIAKNFQCGKNCYGTDKADVMMGTDRPNNMEGRDGDDTLEGFGRYDYLSGQRGDDRLLGGRGFDHLFPGPGDDTIDGGESPDYYGFGNVDWGNDTITDPTFYNELALAFSPGNGPITTRLTSDPVLPEVTNAGGTSTINWDGIVISTVYGSGGDDTVTGDDATNYIFDRENTRADTDNITGAGGNDIIDVLDRDPNDTVSCGGGTDTVYFDKPGDDVLSLGDCENRYARYARR